MATIDTAVYNVQLDDDDTDNGVALVLSSLLGQNLEKYPTRARIARRISRPVSIHDEDSEATASVVFHGDTATVHSDSIGRPGVVVNATVEQILELSQLRMKAGGLLPVGFLTRRGLRILSAIARRRLVVKGLVLHPLTVFRFIAMVSIAP